MAVNFGENLRVGEIVEVLSEHEYRSVENSLVNLDLFFNRSTKFRLVSREC